MITDFKEIAQHLTLIKKQGSFSRFPVTSIHGQINPEIEQAWIDEVKEKKL